MDNSINFRGTFLIKKPTPELKEAILPILSTANKSKNLVFDNVMNSGDVLFVTSNYYDKSIANEILSIPNIQFKYFPTLTKKSGFVKDDTEGAKSILKQYSKTAISAKNKLLSAIKKSVNLRKINILRIQDKNLECAQKVFHFDLGKNNHEYTKNIDIKTGMCTVKKLIKDKNTGKLKKHVLLQITPPGRYGISYAAYIPVSEEENMRRIAIQNGEKIFEYTGPNETFNKNVALARQHYLEQMAK